MAPVSRRGFKSEVQDLILYGQPMRTSTRSYKQLQPEDRMTIASLKQHNYRIRQIADMLQRSATTVSRELSCKSEQCTDASVRAQQSCRQHRVQRRHARKHYPQSIFFITVRKFLCSRWSPEQIALTLAEVEDWQFSSHWEGNANAVGTLVERTSRLLTLVKSPHP
jgi:IS30 family transposase